MATSRTLLQASTHRGVFYEIHVVGKPGALRHMVFFTDRHVNAEAIDTYGIADSHVKARACINTLLSQQQSKAA